MRAVSVACRLQKMYPETAWAEAAVSAARCANIYDRFMQADSAPRQARRVTPLGVVGAVLAVLVVIGVLAWLWGHTLGADLMWWLVPFLGGVALVVLWLGYLVLWAARRRRFAWHLLVIPAIGLLGLTAAFTGLPHKARWAYDEPRLTAAAKAVIADPRAEFYEHGDRRIGSQTIYHVDKKGDVVTFSFFGGSFSVDTLEYRPDGSAPEFGGEVRGRRLSNDWWFVQID